MAKTATTTAKPITRDDLEARFAAVQSGLKGKVEDRRNTIRTIAVAVGVLLVITVFLFGRRSGKRKTTLVEIRRF